MNRKKITFALLPGLFIALALSGCGGSNEATKAAKESNQTEKEGSGENAAAAEQSQEPSSLPVPEEKELVGVLLPSFSGEIRAMSKEDEFQGVLSDAGYETRVLFAGEDADLQLDQLKTLVSEGASALILDPVDAYALGEALTEEEDLPSIILAYDNLVMHTEKLDYFIAFDTRKIGHQIADEIIARLGLDTEHVEKGKDSSLSTTPVPSQAAARSYTIEFLMGAPESSAQLFLFNGILEELSPYLENGMVTCPSGRLDYDQVCVMDEDPARALSDLEEVRRRFYKKALPDVVVTANDTYAQALVEALTQEGLSPSSSDWPIITGVGAETGAVRDIAEGSMAFTVFQDDRQLARSAASVAADLLSGEDPEVSNYEQYDNGVRLVRTVTSDTQIIDGSNYRILVDNGYYEERRLFATPLAVPDLSPAAEKVSPP